MKLTIKTILGCRLHVLYSVPAAVSLCVCVRKCLCLSASVGLPIPDLVDLLVYKCLCLD